MGRAKDLYIEEVERKTAELIDQGMDPDDAYEKASDGAFHALGDKMADMADRARDRAKEQR